MVKKLNMNDVRVIVGLFNRQYGFNLVETKTPPKEVSYFYPYPYIIIEIENRSLEDHYAIVAQWESAYSINSIKFVVQWESVYSINSIEFSGIGERINKRRISRRRTGIPAEIDVYRDDILNKISKIIELYIEL